MLTKYKRYMNWRAKHHLLSTVALKHLNNGLACHADYSIFAQGWLACVWHMNTCPYGQHAGNSGIKR